MPFIGMTPESGLIEQSPKFDSRAFELSIRSTEKERQLSQEKYLRSSSPQAFNVKGTNSINRPVVEHKSVRQQAQDKVNSLIENERANSRSRSNGQVQFDSNTKEHRPVVVLVFNKESSTYGKKGRSK